MKAALSMPTPLLSSRLSKFSWAVINSSHPKHPPSPSPPPEKQTGPGRCAGLGIGGVEQGSLNPPETKAEHPEWRTLQWEPPPDLRSKLSPEFPTEQKEDIPQRVAASVTGREISTNGFSLER